MIRFFSVCCVFFLSIQTFAESFKKLEEIAEKSLKQNIYSLKSGDYLTAGSNQFKSLWARDFALASRGLYPIKRQDVVKRQLELYFKFLRKDGLLPRYVGSASKFQRGLSYFFHFPIPLKDPLTPEYLAGGGSKGISMDTNLLLLLTSSQYVEKTKDVFFYAKHRSKMIKAYRYYDQFIDQNDGLIKQGKYADWQDSVSREGKTFFVNLLYFIVSEQLSKDPGFQVSKQKLSSLRLEMEKSFWIEGQSVYRAVKNHPYVSLEGNLLALDLGYLPLHSKKADLLYEGLKKGAHWKDSFPGHSSLPPYPASWKDGMMKWINLTDYHDEVYWSWLMGLSLKVTKLMKDQKEYDRIAAQMERLAIRDGWIVEVYEPKAPHLPVERVVNVPYLKLLGYELYKSERPFSWGAGMILDALQ